VFHQSDFKNAKRVFPQYYEGKWFIVEFMRGWIMAVTLDEQGNYKSMERFLPEENFSSAIDMKFSPTGDLYVLEYWQCLVRGNETPASLRLNITAVTGHPLCSYRPTKRVAPSHST
jgi:cytochrome c